MKYKGTPVNKLLKQFENSGYTFLSKSYNVIHNCNVADLDFNYKDVAHLTSFHPGFYCYFHSISDKSLVDSRFIEIFKFKIPVTLSSWEPNENEHASLFNLFGFIIITTAKFEYIEINKSKLTTTYNLAHQNKLILKTIGNFVHTLLKKNYFQLLKEDSVIRERRGKLRTNGHEFIKNYEGTYRYSETLDISKNNVKLINKKRISIKTEIKDFTEINSDDLRGIYIIKKNDLYYLHNSTCPHEGANLKNCLTENNIIKCPWHGRLIKPIKIFKIDEDFAIETEQFKFEKKDENLFYESL